MQEDKELEKAKKVETVLILNKRYINIKAKPRQRLVAPDGKYVTTGWVQSEGSEIREFLEGYNFKFEDCTEDGASTKIANIPVSFEEENKIIKYISKDRPEAWEKFNRKDGIKTELDRQHITVKDHECNDITTTVTKSKKSAESRCLDGTLNRYVEPTTNTEKGILLADR